MSSTQERLSGIIGFVLIGVYSWIMMASNGEAASWAWLVLLAAVGLLAATARSVTVRSRQSRNDG